MAQPRRYSLASLLTMPGRHAAAEGALTPQNGDHEAHGRVALVTPLAHSYNWRPHLGIELGLRRGLLESFGLPSQSESIIAAGAGSFAVQRRADVPVLAADGHAAAALLRGVLDARTTARALHGQAVQAATCNRAPGKLRDAKSGAMSGAYVRSLGTARGGQDRTSDSQRDSWFAGFTGSQLAVVWIGRDDNKPTGLWGATGALQAWIALFAELPSAPLTPSQEGLELAWVDPTSGARTQAQCQGARELPFVAGQLPRESKGCVWDEIKSWLGANNETK